VWQRQVVAGKRVIVGFIRYAIDSEQEVELQSIDPAAERRQLERTAKLRAERNAEEAAAMLARVREAARGSDNMLYPMRDALQARCTVGEICGVLREEWGEQDKLRG
jgi:methylmalonyl-CoA mutase N-terminal domain/subunit